MGNRSSCNLLLKVLLKVLLLASVTKICSAGQSKFKVLPIKLQSLPTYVGMFCRHSMKLEGKQCQPCVLGILSFAVL